MVVISNICFNIITYLNLNKWYFLESPFLLFYVEVIIFYNCQVLMLMTDKRRKTSKFQLPKHFIDFCDIRDFLLLFSNRSDFLVIPEDELPGLVKLKTL
jgi:hypothetical protein